MGKKQSTLKPCDLREICTDTGYTEAEIREWYKHFIRTYPTGEIPNDDLVKFYLEFYPQGDVEMFIDSCYGLFDVDKSGMIDFREVMCSIVLHLAGTKHDKMKAAFRCFDSDENGSISKEEMTKLIEVSVQDQTLR